MRKRPNKGIVTIAFDDAYLDTYKHAIRYLTRLKIKTTVAVPALFIGRRFENRPVVGLKELKDIMRSGHEVASHTLTHKNLLRLSGRDRRAAASEMAESKRALERLLHRRVRSFVFPYITKSQSKALRREARSFYETSRITRNVPSLNRLPLKDPCAITGFAVMKKHSLSYLNRQVDRAAATGSWLVLVFHLVGRKNTPSAHRPKPYRYFMHVDDFKDHVDYIRSKDVLILTQQDAVRRAAAWSTKH